MQKSCSLELNSFRIFQIQLSLGCLEDPGKVSYGNKGPLRSGYQQETNKKVTEGLKSGKMGGNSRLCTKEN